MKKSNIITSIVVLGLLTKGYQVYAGNVKLIKNKVAETELASCLLSEREQQEGVLNKIETSPVVESEEMGSVHSQQEGISDYDDSETPSEDQDQHEDDNVFEQCEAIISACKSAAQNNGVQKKLQIIKDDIKELLVEFTREATSAMSPDERKLAQESLYFIENVVKDVLELVGMIMGPGLSTDELDKKRSELQTKLSQYIFYPSSNLQSMNDVLQKHFEIGDITVSTETINLWIAMCDDLFRQIKNIFEQKCSSTFNLEEPNSGCA